MTTQYLAQIIGPVFVLFAISFFARKSFYLKWFKHMQWTQPTLFTIGVFETILGLMIVLNHRSFDSIAAGIITVLGFYMVLEGASALLISKKSLKMIVKNMANDGFFYAISAFCLILGSYLSWVGYVA